MKDRSIEIGWDWAKVTDLTYWQIPDGHVMNLPYYIGSPPATVFDLGCGLGRHTIYFASLGYSVVAYDISNEAVKRTKAWLSKENLKAEVYQGKMTAIPQPAETFDLVLAFNVIYHAFKADMLQTIDEIFRILKPGGYFFGTILTKDPAQPFYNQDSVVDEQTIIKQEEPEKGIPHFFSTIEDVLEFFSRFTIKDLYYKEWYRSPYTLESIADKKGNGHYILFAQKAKEE